MSLVLLHSPADIMRWLLVAMNLVSDPTPGPVNPWPGYVGQEPGTPDNVITLFDIAGKEDGRSMPGGERTEHHGVQVRVRSQTHPEGYLKARSIARALDEDVYQEVVSIDSAEYLVQSVSRQGDVLVLGKETGTSKRSLFTINANVTLRRIT